MSDVEKRLEALGIELPARNRKGKGAVAAVLDGNMLYVSGHLPYTESGELLYKGKVGGNLTQEEGYAAARQCGRSVSRGRVYGKKFNARPPLKNAAFPPPRTVSNGI